MDIAPSHIFERRARPRSFVDIKCTTPRRCCKRRDPTLS